MKVHIVTEGEWIKKFWSDKIVEYNKTVIEYSVGYLPRQDVDINFYICYNVFLYHVPADTINIGYVTHIHANDPIAHSMDMGVNYNVFDVFKKMDGWVHQSQRSMKQFIDMGFPKDKNWNVTSPIEIHKFTPTINIGIFQNGEVEGKGLFFLIDLFTKYEIKYLKFILCGKGWESLVEVFKQKNIRYEVHTYNKEEYYEVKHKELYERIHYLLVPSLWEGGPVAPMEAMACGVPIISSDVGYMPEFTVDYPFLAGDVEGLYNIFQRIEWLGSIRRKAVKDLTYENFNNKLYPIFKTLLESKI